MPYIIPESSKPTWEEHFPITSSQPVDPAVAAWVAELFAQADREFRDEMNQMERMAAVIAKRLGQKPWHIERLLT